MGLQAEQVQTQAEQVSAQSELLATQAELIKRLGEEMAELRRHPRAGLVELGDSAVEGLPCGESETASGSFVAGAVEGP